MQQLSMVDASLWPEPMNYQMLLRVAIPSDKHGHALADPAMHACQVVEAILTNWMCHSPLSAASWDL